MSLCYIGKGYGMGRDFIVARKDISRVIVNYVSMRSPKTSKNSRWEPEAGSWSVFGTCYGLLSYTFSEQFITATEQVPTHLPPASPLVPPSDIRVIVGEDNVSTCIKNAKFCHVPGMGIVESKGEGSMA